MEWKERNIFITGADGFIGSWLARSLVEKGANVTLILRDMKKESGIDLQHIREDVTLVQGDICDYQTVLRILNEYAIDTCFHLAAQALVQIANASPLSTFESNIKGTYTILEACRTTAVNRIVVASSDKAYGSQKTPYTEDSPLLGTFPYDASKVCADVLARSYALSYGMPIAVTRNANTYGGGDLNFSRIIPDAIRCVLQSKEFIIRSDGSPERDYLYVADAVSGYLCLAENVHRKDVQCQAFNFGTQKPVRVIDVFKKISELCGRKEAKLKILGTATNEIDRQYLSIEKARKALGWEPRHTLEQGLKETIAWYKDYFHIR